MRVAALGAVVTAAEVIAPLFLSNVWLGIRTIYKPRRLLPRVSESVALLNSLPNVVH